MKKILMAFAEPFEYGGQEAFALNMYKYINEVLSDREKEILTYRYGLYGKDAVTQRELAAKLGISRSYVSRIEKAAINKIANMFLENSIDYQSGC